MNILIDGLPFFLNQWDLGEYSRELITSLAKTTSFNIHLIKDKEISPSLNNHLLENITLCNLSLNRVNDNYSPLTYYIKKNNIDIYHCLNNGFSCSNITNEKTIATFHNIIPLDYEDYYNDSYKKKFYSSLPNIIQQDSKILCVSNSLKKDLIDLCGIEDNRIEVIYPSINTSFKPLNKYMSNIYLKSKFNINNKFILYTGDFHKRKRFEELLEIFLRIISLDDNLNLIFLSYINNLNLEYFNEINKLVRIMGISHKVKFISSFTIDEKVHFYNAALCYIDFSLYDGMNISLMQAFKCKCPIICSDIPLNRELLGDNAIFIDIESATSMDYIEDYITNIDKMPTYNDSDYLKITNTFSANNSINSLINLYKSIYL